MANPGHPRLDAKVHGQLLATSLRIILKFQDDDSDIFPHFGMTRQFNFQLVARMQQLGTEQSYKQPYIQQVDSSIFIDVCFQLKAAVS